MRKFLIAAFGLGAIFSSGPVLGACATVDSTCYRFQNDKLISRFACSYTSCANVHGASGFWKTPDGHEMSSGKGDAQWKSGDFLNGKPTRSSIRRDGSTNEKIQCFRTSKKGELLCGKPEAV